MTTADSEQLALGVDIGGTKVAAGLVNADGEIVHRFRTPMSPSGSAAEGLKAVVTAIDEVLAHGREVRGIGMISPGPLDPKRGVILNPPNLPCWRDFNLVDAVQGKYGLPTHLDNDANAAGLAEALWGAGRAQGLVFYVTVGTGIGSGIIFNGRIHHGRTGAAAEAGHVSIDYNGPLCGCGKRGCIEALASGPAIARRAQQIVAAGSPRSAMLELAKGIPANITSEIVEKAHRAGDPAATETLRQTAELLGIWLGNMIDILEPDIVVMGGGVSECLSEWFDSIRRTMQKWCVNQRCNEIPLVHARYGAEAGIAGAAALCFDRSHEAAAATATPPANG